MIFRPWRVAKRLRSGRRAIVPSAFMISQQTPAGYRPASLQRSTVASVCPARTSTPPVAGPQREHVAGHHQVVRARVRVDEHLHRARAVGGRDAGRDAVARLDGDGERRAEVRVVAAHHHRDAQLVEALARHRHADEAAAVAGHEVDGLGRRRTGPGSVRSPSFSRSSSSMMMTKRPCRYSSIASSTVASRPCPRCLLPSRSCASIHRCTRAAEQLLHVAGDDVRLQVYRIAGFSASQVRVLLRVGHQRHRERRSRRAPRPSG